MFSGGKGADGKALFYKLTADAALNRGTLLEPGEHLAANLVVRVTQIDNQCAEKQRPDGIGLAFLLQFGVHRLVCDLLVVGMQENIEKQLPGGRGRSTIMQPFDLERSVEQTHGRVQGFQGRGLVGREQLVKWIGVLNMLLGGLLGVYTGILLSALGARPLWNSALLGPLFLVSGLSTAAALVHMIAGDRSERELLAKADNGFLVLSSLPVPVSPISKTDISFNATRLSC